MLVALTGYGTPEAVERSRQAGFDHHLIKPVNAEALQEIMRGEAPNGRLASSGPRPGGSGSNGTTAGGVVSAAAVVSATANANAAGAGAATV
jgi:hypothetical protein